MPSNQCVVHSHKNVEERKHDGDLGAQPQEKIAGPHPIYTQKAPFLPSGSTLICLSNSKNNSLTSPQTFYRWFQTNWKADLGKKWGLAPPHYPMAPPLQTICQVFGKKKLSLKEKENNKRMILSRIKKTLAFYNVWQLYHEAVKSNSVRSFRILIQFWAGFLLAVTSSFDQTFLLQIE